MKGFKPTTTGVPVNESRHTFNGVATITTADIGKAAVLATAEMTVRLAKAGEVPLGQIEMVEVETTGEVTVGVLILGGYRLACDTNAVFAIGDSVLGAPVDGLVESGGKSADLRFVVTEISTIPEGFVGVLKL